MAIGQKRRSEVLKHIRSLICEEPGVGVVIIAGRNNPLFLCASNSGFSKKTIRAINNYFVKNPQYLSGISFEISYQPWGTFDEIIHQQPREVLTTKWCRDDCGRVVKSYSKRYVRVDDAHGVCIYSGDSQHQLDLA